MLLNIDFSILNFIQEYFKNPILDNIFTRITTLGDFGIIWIAIMLIYFSIDSYKKTAKIMLLSFLFTFVICNIILKPLVARMRPFTVNTAIKLILNAPIDYSFPSGHTMFSFAALTVIIMETDGKFFKIFATILCIAIAFSRLYLYVHYPSDVIIGAILGSLISYLSVIFYEKRFAKSIQ